jgi:hypothetical protein
MLGRPARLKKFSATGLFDYRYAGVGMGDNAKLAPPPSHPSPHHQGFTDKTDKPRVPACQL